LGVPGGGVVTGHLLAISQAARSSQWRRSRIDMDLISVSDQPLYWPASSSISVKPVW
jgi:hypothetical protein